MGRFTKGDKGLWISYILIRKIKKWVPWECPCRLCKTYVPHMFDNCENAAITLDMY